MIENQPLFFLLSVITIILLYWHLVCNLKVFIKLRNAGLQKILKRSHKQCAESHSETKNFAKWINGGIIALAPRLFSPEVLKLKDCDSMTLLGG